LPQALQHHLTCRQDRCRINGWLQWEQMNEDGFWFMVSGLWFMAPVLGYGSRLKVQTLIEKA